MSSSLSAMNLQHEQGNEICQSTWHDWLWQCDLHEPAVPRLNRCHLLGLLIARHKAVYCQDEMYLRLGDVMQSVVHPSKKIVELSLRQLRDVVEDVQMHWAQHCAAGDSVVDVLHGLMAKFGDLARREQKHDDLRDVDPERPLRLNAACIKRYTATFCVLFRHLDVEARATQAPPVPRPGEEGCDLQLEAYHAQAAKDTYYTHAMHADIPPAARIAYKQEFAGMYHSITQVVYFHFPDYHRTPHAPLSELRQGTKLIHALALTLQLRPEMKVVMEDEQWPEDDCLWLVLATGKVYLVKTNPEEMERDIFTASSIWDLFALI